jgi:uncharacterized protein (DUF1778 family)
MFAMTPASPTAGKMDSCKELRLHRADEERIRAAAATGLQEADFIRQAALLLAHEVEQRLSLSILPVEAFNAFRAEVDAPGKVVGGPSPLSRGVDRPAHGCGLTRPRGTLP